MRHSTLGGSQDINLATEAKAALQQDRGALKYAPMRKHPCLPPLHMGTPRTCMCASRSQQLPRQLLQAG